VRNVEYPIYGDADHFLPLLGGGDVELEAVSCFAIQTTGRLTIDTQTTELSRPPLLLNHPSFPFLFPLSEITETNPAILIRQPSLLTRRHEVEMGDEHIIILVSEQFC